MRNAAFALLPLGLGILMFTPSAICDPGHCSDLAYAAEPIGVVLILVAVITLFFPASILKPNWLVAAERQGGEITEPPMSRRVRWTVTIVTTSVSGLLFVAAISSGWLTWSLGAFLIVLGLSVLGAMSWITRRNRR